VTNETTERLERFLVRFRDAGRLYAQAAAYYELLEHKRKVVLAAEMKAAELAGFTSAAAQEREARAGEEYTNFLSALYTSRLELEVARSDLEYLRMSATLAQTRKANERAEIRAYQST
jgi:hypothetical protein